MSIGVSKRRYIHCITADTMIALLADLCINIIIKHINVLHTKVKLLPGIQKERILERLVDKELLLPSDESLIGNCVCGPDLEKIKFVDSSQLTDGTLARLAATNCQLKSICVQNCPQVTSSGLSQLLRNQRKLENLDIVFGDFTRRNFEFIERVVCTQLNTVSLRLTTKNYRGFAKEIRNSIKIFLSNNRNITHLSIGCDYSKPQNGFGNDSDVIMIVERIGTKLLSLELVDFVNISNSGIEAIAKKCPKLKSLTIGIFSIRFGLNQLPGLSDNTTIESLTIRSVNMSRDTCNSFKKFPDSVRKLALTPIRILDKTSPSVVLDKSMIHAVTSLKIPMDCLDSKTVGGIFAEIGNGLKELGFECFGPRDESLEMAVVTAIIDHCPNLTSLGLCCHSVKSLEKLQSLFTDVDRANKLTYLRLQCDDTNADICHKPHIRKCAGIEKVNLIMMSISTSCHNLEELVVHSRYVDNDFFSSLGRNCNKLKNIFIQTRLASERRNTYIDTESFGDLVVHCPLEEVCMFGVDFDSESLPVMLGNCCPYLRKFYHQDTDLFCRCDDGFEHMIHHVDHVVYDFKHDPQKYMRMGHHTYILVSESESDDYESDSSFDSYACSRYVDDLLDC